MRLSWKIYAVIYALIVLLNIYLATLPESKIYNYYQILILLDKSHWLNQFLYYFANAMEALSLIPLFLFVFRKKWLSQDFWKVVFIGRLIGLVWGHNYEYNIIGSMFAAKFLVTLVAVIISSLVSLPSFAAQFLYAFRKAKWSPTGKPVVS